MVLLVSLSARPTPTVAVPPTAPTATATAAPTERAVICAVSVAVIETSLPPCDVSVDLYAYAETVLAIVLSELEPEPASEPPPPAPPEAATEPEIETASIVGVETAEICTALADVSVELST